ncbi:MAG: hypothetical protein GY938_25715 [Ketobacter sp.]|nr:hypothetical protein [Ketobacter sp.]
MTTVHIKYIGSSGLRIWDSNDPTAPVWNAENNFICEVDLETAANCLSYPRPDFVPAPGHSVSKESIAALAELIGVKPENIAGAFEAGAQPAAPVVALADITGPQRAGELKAAGITDTQTLAALSDAKLKGLSRKVGASLAELTAWKSAAKDRLGA